MRSAEQIPCPCCGKRLKVIGSRRRKYINDIGNVIILIIRRLRCCHCEQIHHELPDLLVPYKRYARESIEAVVTDTEKLTVAADESTIRRWKHWFQSLANHFVGCLISTAVRYHKETVEGLSCLPKSALHRIWHLVGDAPAWLARVVRPVANLNNWIHTRSAFMS